MGDQEQNEKVKPDGKTIVVEDVPDYLYDQIEAAAKQTGQTMREWIMGACHMRYSSQFRDNLLHGNKGGSTGAGSGGPVI